MSTFVTEISNKSLYHLNIRLPLDSSLHLLLLFLLRCPVCFGFDLKLQCPFKRFVYSIFTCPSLQVLGLSTLRFLCIHSEFFQKTTSIVVLINLFIPIIRPTADLNYYEIVYTNFKRFFHL